jgi:hypothetical protein
MALQKQTITLDFGFGGLDQKADPKLVQRVRFTQLENARFNKIGRIDRRNGNAASFTTQIDTGAANALSATAFSATVAKLIGLEDRLLAITGETSDGPPKPFRLNPGSGYASNKVDGNGIGGAYAVSAYMPVSHLRAADMGGAAVLRTGYSAFDLAESSNNIALVYGDLDGNVKIEIYDKTTRTLVRNVANFAGWNPRLVSHPDGRDQWILFQENYSTNASSTKTFDFYTFSATTVITTVVGMPSNNDVRGYPDCVAVADVNQANSALVCIAWRGAATSSIHLRRATWPSTDGSGAALSTTAVYGCDGAVALARSHNRSDTASDFRIFYYFGSSTTSIRTFTVNRNLTVVLATAAIALTSTTPAQIVGCQLASGAAHCMIEFSGATFASNKIDGYTINTSNTASQIWIQRGMSIHSQPAAKSGGEVPYFWALHQPSVTIGSYSNKQMQNTLFLLASVTGIQGTTYPPPTIGRLFHTRAQGNYQLPTSLHYNGSEFVGAAAELVRLGVGLSLSTAQYVIKQTSFSPSGGSGWLSASNKRDGLISGGYLATYNQSEGVIPAGPLLFPTITVSATTSGGSMALGSYAVSGVFEYTDSGGRTRTSAPAVPATFTLTGSQNALIVTVQSYRLGDGLGHRGGNMRFVPYRTLVNESQVYYRTNSVTITPLSDTVSASLTTADATVSTDLPLYTTGGVIENWQPSAPLAVATNGRRVLAVPGDRPCFVMESKPITDTDGVHFMEEVGRSILPHGDRIYALASYQDRWIAFKENGIFVAQGDGADRTGNNDSLSEFFPLAVGMGCTAPRSVLTTSLGVVFQSQKGFYLIGGGPPQYIGASVEDYTSAVKDAAYDAQNEMCYFTLDDGTELVLTIFETEQGTEPRWSVDSTFSLNSSAVLNGVRYIALSSPNSGVPIYKETPGVYVDGHSSVTTSPDLKMTTAWAEPAGLQGLARIYKALFLGRFPAGHPSVTVTVEVGYDYGSAFSETHTISSANFEQNGDHAQFELHPQRTKCEAIRFRISQSVPASDYRGLWLNQVQLTVGVKSGDNKIKSSARARKA